jgi:hypothetical protein
VSFWRPALTNTIQGTFALQYSVLPQHDSVEASENKIPRVGKSGRELINIKFPISTFHLVGRTCMGFLR